MKTLSIALVAALALSACSDKSSLKPLSATEKAQVKETTTSAYRAFSAGNNARPAASHALPSIFFMAGSIKGLNPDKSQTAKAMATKLQAQCEFPAVDPGANPKNFHIVVKGEKCPIDLDVALGFETNGQTQLTATLGAKYAVKQDSEFKAMNDVVGFTIASKMEVTGNQSSATLKMGGTGSINSQKNGTIGLTIAGNVNGNSSQSDGNIAFTLQYPSFSAELKAVIHNRQVTYFINDEQVTEQEFMGYFQQSSAPSNMPIGGPNEMPTPPSNPGFGEE